MTLDTIDLGVASATTGAGAIVATTPDQSTLILSLAVQIVGVVSLIVKHRNERRQKRKSTNNQIK
jgi:uncharacterized membrane protein YdjX (TVP38/TMEM64 family)